MSTAVATLPTRPKSVTLDMADRYGMEPAAFERTLRATVFPANAPPEEFAAFLLVAREHNLNPVTKEIYAYPKRGGGIQPIVSIDGWMTMINSHPAMDGMEFEDIHGDDGELVAIRCKIYRKDRSRPVDVTEYLSECIRPTDPWKMKHRMLRHKAAIQCARYAFGFAGIMEPDEAEKVIDVTPATPARRPPPPPAVAGPESPVSPAETPRRAPPPPADVTPRDNLADMKVDLEGAETVDAFDEMWSAWMPKIDGLSRGDRERAQTIYEEAAGRFG